jgi:hypothetical protein
LEYSTETNGGEFIRHIYIGITEENATLGFILMMQTVVGHDVVHGRSWEKFVAGEAAMDCPAFDFPHHDYGFISANN